jgi:arylsulfatase A-like enzyme
LPDFKHERTAGLRGHKGSLYEGGTRMPFIVRWPGHTPAGRVDETTVLTAVDFFPMFCKLGGTTLPKEGNFDGEDLSRSFFGESLVRKPPIFWEFGRNNTEFPSPKGDHSPNVAVRDGKWKLLVNDDGTGAELYDLDADRNETQDIADKNPQVASRLKEQALTWKKSLP